MKKKLEGLTEDISIFDFLEQNFRDKNDVNFKNSILKMVEGYDAADPKLISTFVLRDEWLSKPSLTQIINDHRIKEGYGALFDFLEDECKRLGVEIRLNTHVKIINYTPAGVTIQTDKETLKALKVIITVPLPILKEIEFKPEISDKIALTEKIGFGNAIKLLIKFKTRWWEKATKHDLSKMAFILCNGKFMTWWTQYPEINTILTGWMAGPEAFKYKEASNEQLLELALDSLSQVLKIDKAFIAEQIITSKSFNWPSDPFTKGAYSYTTIHTKDAYERLAEPVENVIFFAGEALYSGEVTATVEGAFGSGLETARLILNT